jgi:hypothetical protein
MDLLTVIIQLIFGQLVRKWKFLETWPNKLIPVFNAVAAILVQVVAALTSVAHAADSLSVTMMPQSSASHGHPGWWAVWHFLSPVVFNTLLSTGIFSAQKNVVEHMQGR